MTEEESWQRYDRDKLPSGWAYPLGRDEVGAALVRAGVKLGSLSFSRTQPNKTAELSVLHVYWPSDARAKYFHPRFFDTGSSSMKLSVSSVPSHLRGQVAQQLRGRWLGDAIAWAHQAPARGNAWTSADHYWILIQKPDGSLVLEES
jgi:hypothetical protein